ncbi:hypothetical protein QZG57_11995 [Corynebacterium glucuronolyticum]
MATNKHAPGFSYITVGIHTITALLLAVTVATSLSVGLLEFMQVSFLAVTFGAIYYVGNHFFEQLNSTQHGLWTFGLTALWILLLPHHLSALYFVYLRSFDERIATAWSSWPMSPRASRWVPLSARCSAAASPSALSSSSGGCGGWPRRRSSSLIS